MVFEKWYEELQKISYKHNKRTEILSYPVLWEEEFSLGYSPEEAFYGNYPEHKKTFSYFVVCIKNLLEGIHLVLKEMYYVWFLS